VPPPPIKYNPAFLTPDELIQSFVVRYDDLEAILRQLRENADAPNNQHMLILGPRGSGKTTLVMRAAVEIARQPTLAAHWHPLVFAEESYEVSTPGEFWLEAIFHLKEKSGDPRWSQTYDELARETQDERLRERALGQLLSHADSLQRRILLIVENLNMLLGDQLSNDDAWILRHTLQNEKRLMLLATATSRFEQIEQADKAMFELFRVHQLHPLSQDDCRTVWTLRSGQDPGAGRTRAIEILTGGNPRLLTIIGTFGKDVSFHDLMQDLVRLVDDHTEYFKSHLDSLAATERKVYLALAEIWDPATAREVAEAARMEVSATSALLRRLIERGAVVEADGSGERKKCYQVAERMYNIYYLMRRRGAPSRRVHAVVNFVVQFYAPDEVVSTARRIAEEACGLQPGKRQDHYQAYQAILERLPDPNIRKRIVDASPRSFFEEHDAPPRLRQWLKPPQGPRRDPLQTRFSRASADEARSLVAALLPGPGTPQERLDALMNDPAMHHAPAEIWNELEESGRTGTTVDPDRCESWLRLAVVHDLQERNEEAVGDYRRAIDIQANCGFAWMQLGKLLLYELGRYAEAEEACRRAVELRPGDRATWLYLGASLHERPGRYKEAEAAYRKHIDMHADCEWAWAHLGRLLHERLGRHEEAEAAYRKVIEIKPDYAWAWAHLGQLLHERPGRYEEAEAAYRKAIEIDAAYEWAWAQLGRLLHERPGRYEEAEAAYRKAIELRPDDSWNWVQLGNLLHEQMGRYREAEAAYRKAIEIKPDFEWAWAHLGQLLHELLGRYEEAEAAYHKAIEIRPNYGWAIGQLVRLLFGPLRRQTDALSLAETSIDHHRDNPALLNSIAHELYLCGEASLYARAESWARQAVTLAPDDLDLHQTLGLILVASGKGIEAIEFARRCLQNQAWVRTGVNDVTELLISLAAAGYAQQAVTTLNESPSAEVLEPLLVGLRLFSGEKVRAAVEIREVAKDVVRRIEDRRSGQTKPS